MNGGERSGAAADYTIQCLSSICRSSTSTTDGTGPSIHAKFTKTLLDKDQRAGRTASKSSKTLSFASSVFGRDFSEWKHFGNTKRCEGRLIGRTHVRLSLDSRPSPRIG